MTTTTNYYLTPDTGEAFCTLRRADRPDVPIAPVFLSDTEVEFINKLFRAAAERAWQEGAEFANKMNEGWEDWVLEQNPYTVKDSK
jgi:hypothetical protein